MSEYIIVPPCAVAVPPDAYAYPPSAYPPLASEYTWLLVKLPFTLPRELVLATAPP